jgi:hypothetical protein
MWLNTEDLQLSVSNVYHGFRAIAKPRRSNNADNLR